MPLPHKAGMCLMKICLPEVANDIRIHNAEVFEDVLHVFKAVDAVSGQQFVHIF